MKPAPFEYHRPASLDEALTLLSRFGGDARPLAGGQSLIPVLNFRLARPAVLVDLDHVGELRGIASSGGRLRAGAMTRQAALERDGDVARYAPLLAAALPYVAHPQIRNRGTLGGSLAHADPAAELPAVMLACDATLHVRSVSGSRALSASEFFTGLFATALAPDELLVAIELPSVAPGTGVAFDEVARRHGDFALVGVATTITLDAAGTCTAVRIVAINTANGATRLHAAESVVIGERPDARFVAQAAAAGAAEIELSGDLHASAVFRRHLARVLTQRTLTRAVAVASSPSEH